MPREPRMKFGKPSERIAIMSLQRHGNDGYKPSTAAEAKAIKAQECCDAIIDFLDEKSSKEEPEMCPPCMNGHHSTKTKGCFDISFSGPAYSGCWVCFCSCHQNKEGSIVGERDGKNWIRCGGQCVCCDVAQAYFLGEKSHQIQEKECKFCEMTDGRPGGYCLEHGNSAYKHVFEEETTTPKNPACGVTDQMLGEPVSERNDDDAKKCPYRIPDCPIDYPDVSERNSLIDELVKEVDKLIGNLNFKDMVINILKSKKK